MPLFLPTGFFGTCHDIIMYLSVELQWSVSYRWYTEIYGTFNSI